MFHCYLLYKNKHNCIKTILGARKTNLFLMIPLYMFSLVITDAERLVALLRAQVKVPALHVVVFLAKRSCFHLFVYANDP